jgi:hypothetical protein
MKFTPPKLEKAMEMSDADPEAAAEVLRIAAGYLRDGKKMPQPLAWFLADAFERAMRTSSSDRRSALLINLKLQRMNRRPVKANWEEVGCSLSEMFDKKIPMLQAKEKVAEDFGISESTVSRLYKTYLGMREIELIENGEMNDVEWSESALKNSAKQRERRSTSSKK